MVLLNVLPSSAVLGVLPASDMILDRLEVAGLMKELASAHGIPEIMVSEYVDSTADFLVQVAQKRGRLGREGVPLLDEAGKIVLNDWATGKIKWWCVPVASTEAMDDKAVVSEWAEAFDIDALMRDTDVEMRDD
jgi:nuclear GTP-binding protein